MIENLYTHIKLIKNILIYAYHIFSDWGDSDEFPYNTLNPSMDEPL